MNSEMLRYFKMLEEKEFLEAKIESLDKKIEANNRLIDELIAKLKLKLKQLRSQVF